MKRKPAFADLEIDKMVHERARLLILTYLASGDSAETGFTELRAALAMTAGNLSIQLKNLEEAGYVATEKRFQDNKPYTGVRLTVEGQSALERYLAAMEELVASVRKSSPGGKP
jgi:DNA-binding MarR family transcriptional regulator